jgi:hypothetical protein
MVAAPDPSWPLVLLAIPPPGRQHRGGGAHHVYTFGSLTVLGGVLSIHEAMRHAQITTSQRYVHGAPVLGDSVAQKLPIEFC